MTTDTPNTNLASPDPVKINPEHIQYVKMIPETPKERAERELAEQRQLIEEHPGIYYTSKLLTAAFFVIMFILLAKMG